jgi:hypothetical protein
MFGFFFGVLMAGTNGFLAPFLGLLWETPAADAVGARAILPAEDGPDAVGGGVQHAGQLRCDTLNEKPGKGFRGRQDDAHGIARDFPSRGDRGDFARGERAPFQGDMLVDVDNLLNDRLNGNLGGNADEDRAGAFSRKFATPQGPIATDYPLR